jgi:hypothetical protein
LLVPLIFGTHLVFLFKNDNNLPELENAKHILPTNPETKR